MVECFLVSVATPEQIDHIPFGVDLKERLIMERTEDAWLYMALELLKMADTNRLVNPIARLAYQKSAVDCLKKAKETSSTT